MKKTSHPDKPIRCAVYDRVSTELQAEFGRSLETQRSDLDQYARDHGYLIVDHYTDEGITARKKMQNRHDFLRLLEDVKADKIDLILVTKLDRWFRNIRDYYATQEILEKHHCNWKTIYEDYDSSTADGQLKINIMLSVAQNECDRTSERIKSVFRHKVQLGEITTASLIYFGYRCEKKHLVIDEEKAPIVRDVYRKFFETHSKQTVYRYCMKKYGDIFSYQTFRHFFTAEIYAGRYQTNEHFCPPYLTPDQWEEIQSVNARNIKVYAAADTPSVYLFSGLLRCPECGSALSGTSVKTRYGHINHYYRCWKHQSGRSCTFNRSLSELRLEKYLTAEVLLMLPPPVRIPTVRALRPAKPAIRVQTYEGQLKRLNDLYIRGNLSCSEYDAKYASIQERIQNARQPAAPDAACCNNSLREALQDGWAGLYHILDRAHKRSFWHHLIASISFDDSKNIQNVAFLPQV